MNKSSCTEDKGDDNGGSGVGGLCAAVDDDTRIVFWREIQIQTLSTMSGGPSGAGPSSSSGAGGAPGPSGQVSQSDTSLWLHNKLGTSNDSWTGGSIVSQLSKEILGRNDRTYFQMTVVKCTFDCTEKIWYFSSLRSI